MGLNKFIFNTRTIPNTSYHDSSSVKERLWKWSGSDQKVRFENNLKDPVLELYLKPYIDNPIEYRLNKQMLRCSIEIEQFKNKPVDLFLGCSHMFGTGHHEENTIPFLVSKHTNNLALNLALGGAGIELSYLRLLKFVRTLNVQNVFHYQPAYPRYAYYKDNRMLTWIMGQDEKEMRERYGEEYVYDNYMQSGREKYEYMKFLKLIMFETNLLNIPYYHLSSAEGNQNKNSYAGAHRGNMSVAKAFIKNDMAARDLLHKSVNQLKNIADCFVKDFKQYPNGKVNEAFPIEVELTDNKSKLI